MVQSGETGQRPKSARPSQKLSSLGTWQSLICNIHFPNFPSVLKLGNTVDFQNTLKMMDRCDSSNTTELFRNKRLITAQKKNQRNSDLLSFSSSEIVQSSLNFLLGRIRRLNKIRALSKHFNIVVKAKSVLCHQGIDDQQKSRGFLITYRIQQMCVPLI